MSNDSTTSGYLTPVGDEPLYGQDLEQEITQWISGVSGLDSSVIYSRWINPPPSEPDSETTWCEFGITTIPQPFNQANIQVSDEQSELWSWENVTVLCCFYGPQSASVASLFRDGIFVSQNNVELNKTGLSLLSVGTLYSQPELLNTQWVRRYDITVTLSRKNTRTYNIRTLQSASVQFFGE